MFLNNKAIIPIYCRQLKFYDVLPAGKELYAYAIINSLTSLFVSTDIIVFDSSGEIYIEINDFSIRYTDRLVLYRELNKNYSNYMFSLNWLPEKNIRIETTPSTIQESYLIFSENNDDFQNLSKKLSADITKISHSSGYTMINANEFNINYGKIEDFALLFEALRYRKNLDDLKILIFIDDCLQSGENIDTVIAEKEAFININLLLNLVKTIKRAGNKIKIFIFTKNVNGLNSGNISITAAPVWGIFRTMINETPEIAGGIIDLPVTGMKNIDDRIVEILKSEVCARQIIINEQNEILTPSIEKIDNLMMPKKDIYIYPDATYLITGGYGAIGKSITRWLVELGAKNIVLLGRTGASATDKIFIEKFYNQGVNIKVESGDVSNPEDIKLLMERINNDMPELRGIFHTAGVLQDAILLNQTEMHFRNVMNPKFLGSINLYNTFMKKKLDFIILFSSFSSIIGSQGQANYAAANMCLNSFAGYMKQKNINAYSISWGPWLGGGMADGSQDRISNIRQMGLKGFKPNDGLQILSKIITFDDYSPIAVDCDWQQVAKKTNSSMNYLFSNFVKQEKSEEKIENESEKIEDISKIYKMLGNTEFEKKEHLKNYILSAAAEIMEQKDQSCISLDTSLIEMGFDSLMLVNLMNKLSECFSMEMTIAVFYEFETVNKLTDYFFIKLNK